MAVIVPFRAVRPRKEYVAKVASYPYDIISSEEAREIAKDNPLSFLHVTKSEIDLPADINPYDDEVYRTAKRNFEKLLAEGILAEDREPSFYVYCQRMGRHEQCGIGACVHVTEFESGRVKKHEMTLTEKEADRTRHIDRVNAQTGPIFLTYRSRPEINRLVGEIRKGPPEYDFLSDNGVVHTLWVVRDQAAIRRIEHEFRKVDSLYIADGHHRAASGVAVAALRDRSAGRREPCADHKLILAVLFPHDQLRIMDYNRIVKDLAGLDEAEFLEKIGEKFAIEPGRGKKSPEQPHEFGMYLRGRWFSLKAREGICRKDDVVGSLDVSILHENLLGPVLGIRDPRGDRRIRFVGGIRGAGELEKKVDSGEYAVAFTLYPPAIDQMMAVADEGKVMPPKSTWFEPKLRDGILVHVLGGDGGSDDAEKNHPG